MSGDTVSKQQRAFFRKLYLSFLISQEQHNLTSLQKQTGMPRRTIQDSIKDLSDVGIECAFIQHEGGRHNEGHYEINDWGPIRAEWIAQQQAMIESVLFGENKS